MDPITTALVTALAIPVAKDVITDSYTALKNALTKKFGDKSDVVNAVQQLEEKPDSKGRQATLEEEIANAKVNNDPEIMQLAQALWEKLQSEETTTTSKYQTTFQGEVKGAQIGDRNTQQNTFN